MCVWELSKIFGWVWTKTTQTCSQTKIITRNEKVEGWGKFEDTPYRQWNTHQVRWFGVEYQSGTSFFKIFLRPWNDWMVKSTWDSWAGDTHGRTFLHSIYTLKMRGGGKRLALDRWCCQYEAGPSIPHVKYPGTCCRLSPLSPGKRTKFLPESACWSPHC